MNFGIAPLFFNIYIFMLFPTEFGEGRKFILPPHLVLTRSAGAKCHHNSSCRVSGAELSVPSCSTASLQLLPGNYRSSRHTGSMSWKHMSVIPCRGKQTPLMDFPSISASCVGREKHFQVRPWLGHQQPLELPRIPAPSRIPQLGSSERLLPADPGLDPQSPAEGMWPSGPTNTPRFGRSLHLHPLMRVMPQIPNAASERRMVPLCLHSGNPKRLHAVSVLAVAAAFNDS